MLYDRDGNSQDDREYLDIDTAALASELPCLDIRLMKRVLRENGIPIPREAIHKADLIAHIVENYPSHIQKLFEEAIRLK